MIPGLMFLLLCPVTIFTPVHPLSMFWGAAPSPRPCRVNTCTVSSLWRSIIGFSGLRDEAFCVPSHSCQRDFLGWDLVEVMFSLRANGEGTQLGTGWKGEGRREARTGMDANVVLIISKFKVQYNYHKSLQLSPDLIWLDILILSMTVALGPCCLDSQKENNLYTRVSWSRSALPNGQA